MHQCSSNGRQLGQRSAVACDFGERRAVALSAIAAAWPPGSGDIASATQDIERLLDGMFDACDGELRVLLEFRAGSSLATWWARLRFRHLRRLSRSGLLLAYAHFKVQSAVEAHEHALQLDGADAETQWRHLSSTVLRSIALEELADAERAIHMAASASK